MSAEQKNASPATAGGAPNPAVVENVVASALMEQYGFVPLNIRYAAAKAARTVVEALNPIVPAAEAEPVDRKPVYDGPGVDMDWDEDADAMVVHGIGWNLSWNCKLSIARDHDTGEHYVCVNTSGEDQRKGIVSRSTSPEQIASFGQQLLNVFGEPDPRDAEIKRLREELDKVSGGWAVRVASRQVLVQERDEAREEWKRADAEVTRLKRLVGGENAALTADRDRWLDHYNQLIGDALHVQQHLQRALGKPASAGEEFDRGYSRSMVGELAAQRDRLHVELDQLRPKFKPGQQVRVGQCRGTVHQRLHPTTFVELDGGPVAEFQTRHVTAVIDAQAASEKETRR